MKEKIGTYWKTKDSATIYWSKNSTNIRKDHTFDSAQEYRKHRVAHGYGPGWSGILVLNNYIHDPDDDIKIQENEEKEDLNHKEELFDFQSGFSEINDNISLEIHSNDVINKNSKNGFDAIYIVHLNRLDERKLNILNQINNLYNVKIIDAVDKTLINMDILKSADLFHTKNSRYCKDRNFCWCNGKGHGIELNHTGRVACLWSHSKVYDDIVMNNIQNALVLEDDFDLMVDMKYLKMIEKKLPNDYEYIYFGHSRALDGRFQCENYDDNFVKLLTGWKETICYAISFDCSLKLQQIVFPFRGAIDGVIRQCIDTTKIINNPYCSKNDLAKNLSGFSGNNKLNTTIDKNNINDNTPSKLNIKLIKKSFEYDFHEHKKNILIVTGYFDIKNKFTKTSNVNNVYIKWMSNTLLFSNDMCIFYDNDEIFKIIHNIRKTSLYKTYYIKKTIDKFFVNKFNLDDVKPTTNVPYVDLGKVYNEKMFLVYQSSIKYNNYEYYSWIDIGLPLFRKKPITNKSFINFKPLSDDKFNHCLTNFGIKQNIVNDYLNNVHNTYYHNIAGGAWIIHNSKINTFNNLYYKELEYMVQFKNKINNSLILDDQCIWTKVYSKNTNLFNMIYGRYGEYIEKIFVPIQKYSDKGNGGLGNQLITLMFELYINRLENYEVLFEFRKGFILSKIFKKLKFIIRLDGYGNDYKSIERFYRHKFREKINCKDVKQFSFNKILKFINYSNSKDTSYDTIIHIRCVYNNDDHHYYLQPPMCYYEYIFENFDLGKNIAIVYGTPKNPIVDEIAKKYNIKNIITSSPENDLLTMSNCNNLIWDTSTMCWASYLISQKITKNFIFDDFKKFIKSPTFFDDETFIYINVNKSIIDDVNKNNINDIKCNMLTSSIDKADNMLLITGFWKVKNKYKSQKIDETYLKWMTNTLQIQNDLCIYYEDEDILKIMKQTRKDIPYKTMYIKKCIEDFYINNFDFNGINPTYNCPSINLAKIYLEKIRLLKLSKNDFHNYTFYGWMDIGTPIYRKEIPCGKITNIHILEKNVMNCNHTHHQPRNNTVLDKFKNDEYSAYYHTIAGTSYVLHKDIIDKYDKIFYDHFEKMLTFKNTINQSLIIDDQCLWTQIYSKDNKLFNIIPGSYGQILTNLTKK
tara:strand:- start:2445 stop:5864 length:3420 start_codon:yes stop_codon:yes gene_type:complete